ncbi:hypothetical protein C4A75_09495 [Brevibacillus laterosporus]|uniref:Uncharacterized protein n=1 Tax=Brevibacillus laterosporus TaxID=1465 RepID=A0AAP8U770_BRELA|nr:hypothetical protein [Brevibacillus laterosporus]PPA85001.1 hypothetical protein C4A75_09495 [Brevibacillus laterosporus]PPB12899.1 hypothetical protein C4A77_00500 [Brevibacillus laterosporus]
MDNFKFKVNKEEEKTADDTIFSVKPNGENYMISWDCESGKYSIFYPVSVVEALLEDGVWIIVDDK